jgi:golgi-specific brefeldin A-resistance guanine nucleotide exchange factor 1
MYVPKPLSSFVEKFLLLCTDHCIQEHDFMRTPVVLHAISSFDDATIDHTASSVIAGLSSTLSLPGSLKNEVANSPDFWSILQRVHGHQDQAQNVFDILEMTVRSDPPIIAADNYESAVTLANDFATASSKIAVDHEQTRNGVGRRNKPPRKEQESTR